MKSADGKVLRKAAIRKFKRRFFSISGYISFTIALFFAGYLILNQHELWPHAFLMVLPASLPVVRQPIFETGNSKHFFAYLLLMLAFIGMVTATVPAMGLASLLAFGSVLGGSWLLTAGLIVAEKNSQHQFEQREMLREYEQQAWLETEFEEDWEEMETEWLVAREEDDRHMEL